MRLKRVVTPHQNENDCWNIVIAKALDMPYDQVRKEMSPLMQPNGSMLHNDTMVYLTSKSRDWFYVDLHKKVNIVKDVMKVMRLHKYVLATYDPRKLQHHLSYVDGRKLYTTSDTDECFNDRVDGVWFMDNTPVAPR